MPCTPRTVCLSKNSVSSKNWTCGYDGNSYCPLFEGDSVVTLMINSLASILALSIGVCHTNDRLGASCFYLMNFVDKQDYWKYISNANLYLKNDWVNSHNDSTCIKETAEAWYWNQYYQGSGRTIQQCPVYSCATNSSAWENNQCVFEYTSLVYDAPFQSIQATNCSEGTLCAPGLYSNATCQATGVSLRYPGDYCTSGSQCTSSQCSNNLCSGVGYNETCVNPTDCDPKLYCTDNNTCQFTLDDGANCTSDYQCGTYSICMDFRCGKMFSMPLGSMVLIGMPPYGYNRYCDSGYSVSNGSGFICSVAPTSYGLSTICDSNGLCTDTTGTDTKICSCGFDSELHCPAFEGDVNLVNAIIAFHSMAESDYTCNSGTKYSEDCLRVSDSLLTTYYIHYTNMSMYVNYVSIQTANATCFRNVTNVGYWSAYNYLNPQPSAPTPVPPTPHHGSSRFLSALIGLLLVNL